MSYKITLWDRIRWWWSRNITDRIYWWKCRLWRKHNHVRIRSLPPTWTDCTEKLPHAMFQMLSDYMEKEKPGEVIDWSWCSEQANTWKEIQELYDWWNNVYLKFDIWKEAPIRDRFKPTASRTPAGDGLSLYSQEWSSPEDRKEWEADWARHAALEKDMECQLTENCIRLIKIRESLWT